MLSSRVNASKKGIKSLSFHGRVATLPTAEDTMIQWIQLEIKIFLNNKNNSSYQATLSLFKIFENFKNVLKLISVELKISHKRHLVKKFEAKYGIYHGKLILKTTIHFFFLLLLDSLLLTIIVTQIVILS